MSEYLVYDLEIEKAIPDGSGNKAPGIAYCNGWHDHRGMGISCIGAYDSYTDRFRVFGGNQRGLEQFEELAMERETLVGFNNIAFDEKVLKANGVSLSSRSYDLLAEVWKSLGGRSKGYKLDDLALKNLGVGKNGSGAFAPVLWQTGKFAEVIDYCLEDVRITRDLYRLVQERGFLEDPNNGKHISMKTSVALGR